MLKLFDSEALGNKPAEAKQYFSWIKSESLNSTTKADEDAMKLKQCEVN